jgi:hypothetical protein
MRPMMKMFVFAAALVSTSAAFAASKVRVNVPFSFESHGRMYEAGTYDVALNPSENVITLTNHNHPEKTVMWLASPAEFGPNAPTLSMRFNDGGDGSHELRSIRIATRTTPVLDVRERHASQREVSITGGR